MSASDVIRSGYLPVQRAVFAAFETTAPVEEVAPETSPADASTVLALARQQAEAAGYAEGYRRGRSDGERLLAAQASRLRALIDRASSDVAEALAQLEPQVIELAFTIASRVVERELSIRPDLVVDVVRAALAAAATLPVVRVRVHPDDHPHVVAAWDSLTADAPGVPLELVADPRIEVGGCIVDTSSGFVDAQPRVRLDELRMQIMPITGGER